MLSFYDSNMTELNDDIYEATLKINQVSQSSYGDYICKGQNTMGAKRTIIKLQVRIVEDMICSKFRKKAPPFYPPKLERISGLNLFSRLV